MGNEALIGDRALNGDEAEMGKKLWLGRRLRRGTRLLGEEALMGNGALTGDEALLRIPGLAWRLSCKGIMRIYVSLISPCNGWIHIHLGVRRTCPAGLH